MPEINNTELLTTVFKALYTTVGRRTTQSFAIAVIDTIKNTIEERYDFLKYVKINLNGEPEDAVKVNSKIESVHPVKIGKSIEAIVQIVCMDLKEKAGLYFINEVKTNLGEDIIMKLRECGVDLELLMLQQNYLFKRQERKKDKDGQKVKTKDGKPLLDNHSLLGYTEENISSWSYEPKTKICIIYDKNGNELDRLNLDTIIRNYIGYLTNEGAIEPKKEMNEKEKEEKIEINEKEFELLKMLQAKDVDILTATDLLKITEKQLHFMVHRLLQLEMLYYISSDEVALTDTGINHVKEKN